MQGTSSFSEALNSIFLTQAEGLSIFSNNAFRRSKLSNTEEQRISVKFPDACESEGCAQIRDSEAEQGKGERLAKKKKKQKKNEKLDEDTTTLTSFDDVKNKRKHSSQEDKEENHGKSPEEAYAAKEKKKLKGQLISLEESTVNGIKGKRNLEEEEKTIKRHKISSYRSSIPAIVSHEVQAANIVVDGSQTEKLSSKRKKNDSPDTKIKKKRRKLEDSIEDRYENKYLKDSEVMNDVHKPDSKDEEEKHTDLGLGTTFGNRKRIRDGEQTVEPTSEKYDTEEKLKRTIFVGNLPLSVKKKALIKEFSAYGAVESVRLRSVPLINTKIPRKGAIIKGQINDAINSQHAYVVFKEPASANAALAHNSKEFCGNHLRVDVAYAPRGTMNNQSAILYDPHRSIFVGNIPFDVKDEELYKTFHTGKSPEMGVEAIRVIRDPQTSASKGFAYVLFKTKAGALSFLSPGKRVKLRDRILRIRRVITSSKKQKDPGAFKRPRNVENVKNDQVPRKRAKLSASYQGIRASKEKQKLTGKKDGHGPSKSQSKAVPRAAGAKRKRAEKHQRGISRSKKIRRT
ncbi:hypothetical protein KP509_32G016000 [Ceratopteris richardii]|uniref:RRM domain-containing protein n=1 Tax=Ceratopteris richardii TaxID=49495 RepID=A0A8T2QRL2_CERRI|nr:hypothetical protein KP509_32G016000 [Ceratopteris richardii]